MKRAILFVLLALVATAVRAQQPDAPAEGEAKQQRKSIVIYPAKLSFELDKGGSKSQTINISNTTNNKFQLQLEFMDWTRDTIGKHIYLPAGLSRQSCAKWLSFDKPFVELGPGQSTTVTVTLKVPDTEEAISEMKWTMLVFKTVNENKVPDKDAKWSTRINQVVGLGVHIYQTPPNVTNKELKMTSFSQVPGKNVYRIACKNLGGVQKYGKFSIELSDNETGSKTALQPQTIPLFPQQNRYVDFNLPSNLPKGKYTATALIDAGDDDVPIEAAQKEIDIK